MSAVIRVKRRIQDEPLNAFVLNCKKQKTDSTETHHNSLDDEKAAQLTIVKFAGTVENQVTRNINIWLRLFVTLTPFDSYRTT